MTEGLNPPLVESVLAREWVFVLGGASPSEEDDFFACGGDSLAAAELVERLEHTLPVRLSMSDVLSNPEFGSLASRLNSLVGSELRSNTNAAAESKVSVRQAKMLKTIAAFPAMGDSRRISYVFRISADVDIQRLLDALVDAVNSESSLLSRFSESSGGWQVTVDRPRQWDEIVTVVDLGERDPASIEAAVAELRRIQMRPSDPQVKFFHLRDLDLIVAVIGHLVFDGMSLPIFLRRAADIYETNLPTDREFDYFTLVGSWHEQLASGELEDDRTFWKDHVSRCGMWASVRLPSLVTQRAMTPLAAMNYSTPVSTEDAAHFKAWCRLHRVPVYHMLLALAALAIESVQHQDEDFGVEIETSGRLAPGSTSTVGLFTDYVSVALSGLSRDFLTAGRLVHTRANEAVTRGRFPRHLLSESSTALMPTRANWLFRMELDQDRQVDRASDGLLSLTARFDHPESTRVLPGFRLSASTNLDSDAIELRMQVADADLDGGVAVELLEVWASLISQSYKVGG
jgi:acyl carrier protein